MGKRDAATAEAETATLNEEDAAGKTARRKKKKDRDSAPQSYSWVNEFRYGRSISVEFFKKNAWLILIIVVTVIALIGLRYKTITKMEEITRLNTELRRAESEKLQAKSEYMSLIRETEMRKMVKMHGLPLEFQEQPPYEVKSEK